MHNDSRVETVQYLILAYVVLIFMRANYNLQGLSWEFETAGANHYVVNPQNSTVQHNIM